MIIGMEENLEEYKAAIKKAGHRVVPLYGYQGAVDAMVYSGVAMAQLVQSVMQTEKEGGVLMLNVSNMSPEEAVRVIEHKSYSSLF